MGGTQVSSISFFIKIFRKIENKRLYWVYNTLEGEPIWLAKNHSI